MSKIKEKSLVAACNIFIAPDENFTVGEQFNILEIALREAPDELASLNVNVWHPFEKLTVFELMEVISDTARTIEEEFKRQ